MKSMDIHRTKSYSMSDRKEEYKLVSNTDLKESYEENNDIEGLRNGAIDMIKSGTMNLGENETTDQANNEKSSEIKSNEKTNSIESERMTKDDLSDISEDLRSAALRHADSEVTRLD